MASRPVTAAVRRRNAAVCVPYTSARSAASSGSIPGTVVSRATAASTPASHRRVPVPVSGANRAAVSTANGSTSVTAWCFHVRSLNRSIPRTTSEHSAANRGPDRSPRGARHSTTTSSPNPTRQPCTTRRAVPVPMSATLWNAAAVGMLSG